MSDSREVMEKTESQYSYLHVRNITKTFGRFTALKNVSFHAGGSEFLSILGPSGCGKTTVLRVIAGLERQSSGQICIEERDVSKLPVSKRNVGIVFQSYALFPNLNAEKNIAYGLKSQRKNRAEIARRVAELIDLVGLSGMASKYPSQLSGGQQQRVALARAMALSPDLLLLDEPLSALDAKVRVRLRAEIRELQRRLGVTTIMVTHDQEEALTMADRILVMNGGELVQCGTPNEIYDSPATPFVANFIGSMNFIESVEKRDRGVYAIGAHTFRVKNENEELATKRGEKVLMAIRPEDILIGERSQGEENEMAIRIKSMEYRGPTFRLVLRPLPTGGSDTGSAETTFEADVPTPKVVRLELKPDMHISLKLPANRIRIYPAGTAETSPEGLA